MFNSLKKNLNAAIEAVNGLDWATIADVQVCLRNIRQALLVAAMDERDVERFIHCALDSFAGRDVMSGADAARVIQQDLRATFAHIQGIGPVFGRRTPSELTKLNIPDAHAAGRWCLKEFDKVVHEPLHGRRYRQPMMERRIVGPVRLRGLHCASAACGHVDDRHTGPIDGRAINRMIASLRGNDEPGQGPPDIGYPALI
jgi:hypothetical protein